jgi:3'-phosphoadenosine 5'-phosphosulfate sulfotransferase (PAPS reductase)/FAD synthetase
MEYLRELQSYPLDLKISLTKARIREWINKFGIEGVYISFSGGKDSTVLLDIVRGLYPEIEAVFVDVPTQYPELKEFVKTFDNVTILKPKINFAQVCKKYGFPLISKEVSESVEGARKYLTQVINEYDALTDRQTDRQTGR